MFNAGTGDYITVTEIADLVVERLGLEDVRYEYAGGARGWKGDVPIVRFRSDKLGRARLALCAHLRGGPDGLDRCQHCRDAQ